MDRRSFIKTLVGAVAGAVTGVAAKPTVWKQHPPPKFKAGEPPIHEQVKAERFPIQVKYETTSIEKPKLEIGWYFYEEVGFSCANVGAVDRITFT